MNSHQKLPIDYIIESRSDLNLICFLVYNFNSYNRFLPQNFKKYFLNLKNEQYIELTGKTGEKRTLFDKLYSMIENEKTNQEICILIVAELLKERDFFIQNIVKETSIDYVLKMKNTYYSTEILKLLIFYWDIEENQDDFKEYKDELSERSPFCEIMLDLKEGTENSFKVLFERYLNRMNKEFKRYPNLHQTILQKDRTYLLDYKIFSENYRTIENSYFIDRKIPKDYEILDPHDHYIFIHFSPRQQKIQNQIMNSSNPKQFDKILKKLSYCEIYILLLARSQENYENLLEQMLKKSKNVVHHLLQKICSNFEIETFYTKKMLLMVIIKQHLFLNYH